MVILAFVLVLIPERSFAQCASNLGFESGNFTGWSRATDSNFITPASRRYINPGVNMGVINYGATDMYLGTINQANSSVGSRLIKVGNRAVRATADTVYRKYIVDSLSDKLTIYSYGVVELAHNYWNVAVNEAPGFGYEIYVNGKKIDCLKGSFFCGNVDNPPVWQLGTFKDTAGVRKSTGWGAETLNFACFVGDTIEIRLFTRDCILLGHYAYAYFDVVCGDTSKPNINQIMFNNIIEDDELNLYCSTSATLYLEPNSQVCPIFMSNVQWTPQSYIVGSSYLDSAQVNVPDSVWIYATAQFSNYCQTVTAKDSIFVKYFASDPHDNIPKIKRNYCECGNDTIDLTGVDVTSIRNQNNNTMTLTNNKLIVNPCNNFYLETFWKNTSSRITTSNSTIGTSSWTSGNMEGGISYDSIVPGSTIRFEVTLAAGKAFYVGLNDVNATNGHDMEHSVYVNGTNIRAYFNGAQVSNLGTFSGTVNIDFVTLSTGRVRIYINGTLVHSYTNSQRANFPVFADFSAQSNNSPHINRTLIVGNTYNKQDFNRLYNKTDYNYALQYVDRCGITVRDTITYIPGFNASLVAPNVVQCGLNPLNLRITSPSLIDRISWTTNGFGTMTGPANNGNINSTSANLSYAPVPADHNLNPIQVILTAKSGTCTVNDTAQMIVNEIPVANAGPDISTSLDTFNIGGAPSGFCMTCGVINYGWTQGSAMLDSTVSNPDVIRTRVAIPEFVVTSVDPTTGCLDTDTTMLYTSLSNESNYMETHCINGETVEVKWLGVADDLTKYYVIEYSLNGGNNWAEMRRIEAHFDEFGTRSFNMSIKRHPNPAAIYRWTSKNAQGQIIHVMSLDNIECSDAPVYNLYPNPFTDELELNIFSNTGIKLNYTFEIVNQYGQLMYSKDVHFKESNISSLIALDGLTDLSSGVYYFVVKNNGKALYSTMIVKSN